MGRNQRGGLPLHKNLLVATVLNKARDLYMQETMYMNYRLMACGQFNQEDQEDMQDDDTPDTEDYEEDSESDVEDDNDSSTSKDYAKDFVGPSCVPCLPASTSTSTTTKVEAEGGSPCAVTTTTVTTKNSIQPRAETPTCAITNDEGFIDESDCDCDARNFCEDGENRVPFQYCFSCAPFHPSNGRGPTLVGPQPGPSAHAEPEDKLIYDMDLKSAQNQPSSVKRKRQISSEETEDAINSILPKKRRDSGDNLDDSGYQEEEKVFHPAFRDGSVAANGMEVDQITSLVSIFSFGQQVFSSPEAAQTDPGKKSSKDDDDSDSDSDTSSDSGHSSDDHETNTDDKSEERSVAQSSLDCTSSASSSCQARAKDKDLEVASVSAVAAAV